tara:strand:- start:2383 stop:3075 length:693 start_codon:yes stop_codon:yes gene_type:complete
MSHSIRQQLVNAQRFDIHECANQIANLVVLNIAKSPSQVIEATYIYDGESIEVMCDNTSMILGERLVGDFFDAFPEIEIEVKVQASDRLDIDGYYYHTVDPQEEAGLIEVVVSLSDEFQNMSKDRLQNAIQSVLTHEMQHAVQRCHLGIDMTQFHNTPIDHLEDLIEVDARVEEVLCDMQASLHSIKLFKSKMMAYIHEYCKRNNVTGINLDQIVQNHTDFYIEKIVNPI